MGQDTKELIIMIAAVAAVAGLLLGGLTAYAGMYPPFTVVNSGSMQHADDSEIGIVDAGDMMVVQKFGKNDIVTYVDGSQTGYSKFGEYGDVIVYDHPDRKVNIIHRAILQLELQSISSDLQIWHIPSLKNYTNWELQNVHGTDVRDGNWNAEDCTLSLSKDQLQYSLVLTDLGYGKVDSGINLWKLGIGHDPGYKGYLTKGDNAQTNRSFDQNGIVEGLVTDDMIVSTAEVEVPWLGCIKLMMKDDLSQNIPSNSMTNLIVTIVGLLILVIGGSYAVGYVIDKKKSSEDEENGGEKYVRKSKQRK